MLSGKNAMLWLSIPGVLSIGLGWLLARMVLRANMKRKNRWLKFTLLTKAVAMGCAGTFLIAFGFGFQAIGNAFAAGAVAGIVAGMLMFWRHLRVSRALAPPD